MDIERETKNMLRRNYRPAPEDGAEPVHLRHFKEVHGPNLCRELNYQLSLVPEAKLKDRECSHCRGAPAGGLRIQTAVISGSVADRIGWLIINSTKLPLRSDHDWMLELNVTPAADEPLAAERYADEAESCLAPSDVPGYYRLLRGRSAGCRHPGRRDLRAGHVRDVIAAAVRRHRPDQTPSVNGPAVTFFDGSSDLDCVSCVPVCGDAAVPWLAELRARRRPAGWPSDRLLARLDGRLHLVPVGPTASDRRLWRLSFSRPEAALVRALPPGPRYCLMLLKAVRIGRRDQVGAVSSYYLKTCVFWMCEEISDWEDTLEAMHAVLNMLRRRVKERFLPCYFWEELNVLRDPTAERMSLLRSHVRFFCENLTSLVHTMLTTDMKPDRPIRF